MTTPVTKRLAVYAHYDAESEVRRFTTHTLAALSQHCSRIDFVSNSPLPEAELSKVSAFCERTLTQDNIGFDFGMWKHALADIDFDEWDEILLTNSSVFGPLGPLDPMFEKMSADDCDFWAATDSYQQAWHLQSYFLVFKRSTLACAEFRRFWEILTPFRHRGQAFAAHEIGLSVHLTEAGLTGRPYVSAPSPEERTLLTKATREKRRRNPMCFSPIRTLRQGVPFVKAELLRDNPARVRLHPVRRELGRADYDLSLIEFDRPGPDRSLMKRLNDMIHSR